MQQINFLQNLKSSNQNTLQSKNILQLIVLLIVILFALIFFQLLYLLGQKSYLYYLNNQQDKTAQQIQTILNSSEKVRTQLRLTTAADRFKKIAINKQQILQALSNYNQASNELKLSTYLISLASTNSPQVWLTQITIQDHGKQIALLGLTANSAKLLEFVNQLTQQTGFVNREFKTIQLTNTTNHEAAGFSGFQLNTEAIPTATKPA